MVTCQTPSDARQCWSRHTYSGHGQALSPPPPRKKAKKKKKKKKKRKENQTWLGPTRLRQSTSSLARSSIGAGRGICQDNTLGQYRTPHSTKAARARSVPEMA
eukprot:1623152-Rhodomonas_salina.2